MNVIEHITTIYKNCRPRGLLLLLFSLELAVASHLGVSPAPGAEAQPALAPFEPAYQERNGIGNSFEPHQPAAGADTTGTTHHNLRHPPWRVLWRNDRVIGDGRLSSALLASYGPTNHQELRQQQQQQQRPRPRPRQRGYNADFGQPNWRPSNYRPTNLASDGANGSSTNENINNKIDDGPLRKALLSLQNPKLLGGDILVRTGKRRAGRVIKYERSALVSPVSLWPNGVIYYELDQSVAHLTDFIWKVMQQFHDDTCIRFIPRENNEPDYLRIEALRGCFSYIGRIGGEQTLSLGDGCEYRGTIAHELLHAVGFYHHQNRSDRDEFLDILWDNIAKGKESQFLKMAPHENILLNDFDYNSIMLYGPHTFSKTIDKVTMKPKREGVILLEVVEKQGLSALDIDSVNKLYKCGAAYN